MVEVKDFFEFIYDRQAIWHKRCVLLQAAPWSEDEIFRNFKFCNVYRELDGGTLEISKYLKDKQYSPQIKLFNIIAYRFFNRRNTIEHLFGGLLNPWQFDLKYYEKRFDKIKQSENIFSNAYLITACPYNSQYRPKDKHIQILLMLDDLKVKLDDLIVELRNHNPQDGLKVIEKFVPMAGPFLAGQILLDITYCQDIVTYSSNDFLIVGPGAHWGLEILWGKKLNAREADALCRKLWAMQAEEMEKLRQRTGKNWFDVSWKNAEYCGGEYLSLHDIQNSLCEFRKYIRLKNGEKAKKRYYKTSVSI